MSAPLLLSGLDLATTAVLSPSNLKSAGDAVPNPSSRWDTQTTAEGIITGPGEHPNEQAAKEGTQDERLSYYSEAEKTGIKQDLSQHSKVLDKEGPRLTSRNALNAQRKRPSSTTDYA